MEMIGYLIFSMIVGAGIGGMTNLLAITMLFRPYQTWRLGKWNIPFTPGLIPRRHQEIAKKLGELVERELFTVDAIHQKLGSADFYHQLNHSVHTWMEKWFQSDQTMDQLWKTWVGKDRKHSSMTEMIEEHVPPWIDQQVEKIYDQVKHQSLQELLPFEQLHLGEKLDQFSMIMIDKADQFLDSQEGQAFLADLLKRMAERQGSWGNMVSLLFMNDKILDRIRSAIRDRLWQPATTDLLKRQVRGFLEEMWKKDIHQLVDDQGKEVLMNQIVNLIQLWLKQKDITGQPIGQLLAPYRDQINELIPMLLSALQTWLPGQITTLIARMSISTMVQKQILQFPLPHLERLIKDLAKKELRMITWLGACIGGMIGLVQGLILFIYLMG